MQGPCPGNAILAPTAGTSDDFDFSLRFRPGLPGLPGLRLALMAAPKATISRSRRAWQAVDLGETCWILENIRYTNSYDFLYKIWDLSRYPKTSTTIKKAHPILPQHWCIRDALCSCQQMESLVPGTLQASFCFPGSESSHWDTNGPASFVILWALPWGKLT